MTAFPMLALKNAPHKLLPVLALLMLSVSQGWAATLAVDAPKQAYLGQPFVVTLTVAEPLERIEDASLTWLGRTVPLTFRTQEGKAVAQALLGTDVKGGKAQAEALAVRAVVNGQRVEEERQVAIAAKEYPEQRLKVERKYVSPPQKVLARIRTERTAADGALSAVTPGQFWALPLAWPVEGRISSVYGLRRFYNDEPRSPHRGLDIAAITGTPIVAPAPGVVVLTGDHYFAGKSVYVDHGQGVVSAYFHLDSIGVAQGQVLETGQRLGTVGKTGRVTGAHLHFGLYVLGKAVDPMPLMAERPAKGASQ